MGDKTEGERGHGQLPAVFSPSSLPLTSPVLHISSEMSPPLRGLPRSPGLPVAVFHSALCGWSLWGFRFFPSCLGPPSNKVRCWSVDSGLE